MGDKYTATNYGLPAQKGLDEGTKDSLKRSLADKSAIKVGSFADLQRMGAYDEDAELNPNQDPEALSTPAEHDAAAGIDSPEAAKATE